MLHRVSWTAWDAIEQRTALKSVLVDAETGDEAASMGRVAAARATQGRRFQIVSVVPASPEEVAEYEAAQAPVAAVEGDDLDADGDGEVTREELLAAAEARGIAVDRRWGVKRLREVLA